MRCILNKLPKHQYMLVAWFVWGLAAAYYFSDYMARVAPGVMHQELQYAFQMNEAGFGFLTYSFYIPYILMQIPVGLLIDRISIRYLLTAMSLLTALGCLIFGASSCLYMASFARMLIGFSAAFAFITALRLATIWFPPTMLGLLAGLTQALGMLGAATGEAPISWLVTVVGWRACMYCLSLLFIMLAALLYCFIQENPTHLEKYKKTGSHCSILASLKAVLSQKQIWLNGLYAGCLFGPIAVIGESYGPAYLQYGWGLSAAHSASAIGFIFIGWGFGGPLFGGLSDILQKRQILMTISAFSTCILTACIVYYLPYSLTLIYFMFFMLGVTNSGVSLAYATATELVDRKVVGTAIAFTNMASIFVGATLQPLLGYWIDKVAGLRAYNVSLLSLTDFQKPMGLLVLCSFVALILSFTVKDTSYQNIHD